MLWGMDAGVQIELDAGVHMLWEMDAGVQLELDAGVHIGHGNRTPASVSIGRRRPFLATESDAGVHFFH